MSKVNRKNTTSGTVKIRPSKTTSHWKAKTISVLGNHNFGFSASLMKSLDSPQYVEVYLDRTNRRIIFVFHRERGAERFHLNRYGDHGRQISLIEENYRDMGLKHKDLRGKFDAEEIEWQGASAFAIKLPTQASA